MTELTNAREVQGIVQRRPYAFKEMTISLYCTNRMSLENLFYAKKYSIYTVQGR